MSLDRQDIRLGEVTVPGTGREDLRPPEEQPPPPTEGFVAALQRVTQLAGFDQDQQQQPTSYLCTKTRYRSRYPLRGVSL